MDRFDRKIKILVIDSEENDDYIFGLDVQRDKVQVVTPHDQSRSFMNFMDSLASTLAVFFQSAVYELEKGD